MGKNGRSWYSRAYRLLVKAGAWVSEFDGSIL